MRKKRRCYFCENLLRGLKGFVNDIFTGIVMIIPIWVINKLFIVERKMYVIGGLFMLSLIVLYFVVWGWSAKKFWNWK